MPLRDSAPLGAPCWIDLFTSDPDTSRAFYGDLFGWTSEDAGPEFGGYINFSYNGAYVAGAMRNDGSQGTPDGWTIYLAVADAKETADAVAAHGGQVVVPPMDVADLGTMAVAADPTGAIIGIWQPGTHQGFGVLAEPGAPAWFELHTRDHEGAVRFYQEVFGWETSVVGDSDEFRYTTLGEGDDATAGIMDATAFLPEGVPAHWSVYFNVADADATVAQAVAAGATVVDPPIDTPYGRLATLVDPTGARFKLQA
jgi:predicted enzyme related to lactoylglutathione lyase